MDGAVRCSWRPLSRWRHVVHARSPTGCMPAGQVEGSGASIGGNAPAWGWLLRSDADVVNLAYPDESATCWVAAVPNLRGAKLRAACADQTTRDAGLAAAPMIQVVRAQAGAASSFAIVSRRSSQCALLDMKMCASGLMAITVSRLPAGTQTSFSSPTMLGSADPQIAQKLRLWRLDGSLKNVTRSAPAIHLRVACEANRFAA